MVEPSPPMRNVAMVAALCVMKKSTFIAILMQHKAEINTSLVE
jgi:hypothetical protein